MQNSESENRRRLARFWMEAQPSVLAYINAAVPRFHDAEDLLQQVAEDVAGRFDCYDVSRSFVAWVLGIARFKIVDYYRGHKDVVHLSDQALAALADAQCRQVDRIRPMHVALETCIDSLAPRARGILRLRYEQDLSSPEIACQLGSTAKSIRVTLTHIRRQLADCIRRAIVESTP